MGADELAVVTGPAASPRSGHASRFRWQLLMLVGVGLFAVLVYSTARDGRLPWSTPALPTPLAALQGEWTMSTVELATAQSVASTRTDVPADPPASDDMPAPALRSVEFTADGRLLARYVQRDGDSIQRVTRHYPILRADASTIVLRAALPARASVPQMPLQPAEASTVDSRYVERSVSYRLEQGVLWLNLDGYTVALQRPVP